MVTMATRCLLPAPGGFPLARPLEDELAVFDLPFHGFALPYPQGLGERAGYRDEEHALRVLLDADAVGHGTLVYTWLHLYSIPVRGVDECGGWEPYCT